MGTDQAYEVRTSAAFKLYKQWREKYGYRIENAKNGRDELEIAEKARFDGEYVRILNEGGWKAFKMDVRCFLGTAISAFRGDGVVEGGTGELKRRENEKK